MTQSWLIAASLLLITAISPLSAQQEEPSTTELAVRYAHNPNNWPALHYAIVQKRIDVAELILELYPEQATQSTPTIPLIDSYLGNNADQDYDRVIGYEAGISALELAIRGGYTELVAQLLDMGANINEIRAEYKGGYSNSWSPYHQPIVHERCKFGTMHFWTARTLIYWAIAQEDSTMVALLLEYDALLTPCIGVKDWYIEDYESGVIHIEYTYSALKLASMQESTEILELLLSKQAQGNVLNEEYISLFQALILNPENLPALHYAISIEETATFALLLEYGFDIHDDVISDKPLLNRAVEAEDRYFLDVLLARNEGAASEALSYAVIIGDINSVEYLIQDIPASPELLKIALCAGNLEIAQIILAQPHYMEADGEALLLALDKEYYELAKQMICELGYYDEGAHEIAIRKGNEEIFFLLLDTEEYEGDGILTAIECNQPAMLEALLKRYVPTKEEISSYFKWSIKLGLVDIVSLLLDLCPPSDEQLAQYKRLAIEFGQPEILALLMEYQPA